MDPKKLPSIPETNGSPGSNQVTIVAIKETIEIMTGQRGPLITSVVTWQDLVNLGLIAADQVPR